MPKTVLIVDDSSIALSVLEFAVSSAGYGTLTAQGGLEALEILHRDPVDALIVDVNMPGMDGYTLIRKIRVDEGIEGPPIIIATTETEARGKEQGFQAGANVYLVKPIRPQELVAQLQLLIGQA